MASVLLIGELPEREPNSAGLFPVSVQRILHGTGTPGPSSFVNDHNAPENGEKAAAARLIAEAVNRLVERGPGATAATGGRDEAPG